MTLVGRRVALLEFQVIAAEYQVDGVFRPVKRNLIVIGIIERLGKRVVDVETPPQITPPGGSLLQADEQRIVPASGDRLDLRHHVRTSG